MAYQKKSFINKYTRDDETFEKIQAPSIPICVPTNTIRIHPDRHRVVKLLVRLIDNNWYLVNPDLAEKRHIPKVTVAQLFEGIDDKGNTFVLPLTNPISGCESWHDTLADVIKESRKHWVRIDRNKHDCEFIPHHTNQKLPAPHWPDHDFDDVIERAFKNRVINTDADIEKYQPRKKTNINVIEGDD